MTDKELLEMAAKAAGIEIEWHSPNIEVWDFAQVPNWNPLTDDGDALRLAVNLRIVPACGEEYASVYCDKLGGFWGVSNKVLIDGDKYAATRRAIVRAAAEIGKTL